MDALTGLYNRLYFNDAFEKEADRVRRGGHTRCILLADVDRFKEVNDTFGHLVGDSALRAVAGTKATPFEPVSR
jgi:diguanylate cyclase (GGDEF)-like protein